MTVMIEPLCARTQGAYRTASRHIRFCVWAPTQQSVTLVLGSGADRRLISLPHVGQGYFEAVLPELPAGTRYAYRLGNAGQSLPDPASRWQPEGVHRPSALFFPEDYRWHDAEWRGLSPQELVIYELHVGTFTPAGTFSAAIPRLQSLKQLGMTAIEIMPVAQFPGERNWGYDGVHPYAVQNSYGGPQGLMEFVDAAHGAGLGVILDVVYNHLGPEGNYISQFGPYFLDHYHTPWGAAWNYDGRDSDPIRRYVIHNACQWIRDFHIDGLRLDAVQEIYDGGAYHLLAELQAEVQRTAAACGRRAIVIAETDQNDARITAPTDRGGFGLDGAWSDDFHHSVHALLTGERHHYYTDFGAPSQLAKSYRDVFVYDGSYRPFYRRRHGSPVRDQSREKFVVAIQNHDQIGNRAQGERLSVLLEPAAQRLAAALLLISPNTPLLFMGEEYGETRPFPFFCSFNDPALREAVRRGRKREFAEQAVRTDGAIPDATLESTFQSAQLDWSWQDDPHRRGLRNFYQTLLMARRTWPALQDRQQCSAQVLEADSSQPVLLIERGAGKDSLFALANLGAVAIAVPDLPSTHRQPIVSTAEHRFGGQRPNLASLDELTSWEMIIWGDPAWI